jgi:hypothetical protein
LVVLRSRRPRLNGVVFALAFLLGGAVVLVVVVAAGSIELQGGDGQRTALSVVELAGGVLLIAAGRRRWRGLEARRGRPTEEGRTRELLNRLTRISPATSLGAGFVLGIGGPKRLTLGILAASTVTAAGATGRETLSLLAVYAAVGALFIWAPVLLYLVAGRRSEAWLAGVERWLLDHQSEFGAASMLVLGPLLAIDALVALL